MGVPPRENHLLKLVHPGRYIESYREPVIAGEIMKKYPRHCIARPDVFQNPWIAVRPESVLVPGKVFYLVPFHTMHKLLEDQKQRNNNQHSSRRNQSDHYHHPLHRHRRHHPHHEIESNSPIKSMAGVTPKHLQYRYKSREFDNKITREYSYSHRDHQDQDSDGSLYKLSFFKSWNTVREKLHQDKDDYEIDSLFDDIMTRNRRPRVTSPEHNDLRLRSCMRKPDSVRKLLELKVTFTSSVVIPTTPGGSPDLRLERQKSQCGYLE